MNVTGKIDYLFEDSLRQTQAVKSTRDNVVITSKQETNKLNMALNIYNAQDGLVISEIFYTGTLTPDGKMYSDDQYFKIGNNSDSVLYLDSLALVESSMSTDEKNDYQPDLMNEAMTCDVIYMFPGSGKDYPIKPGQEILLALNARNHKEFNPQSMDLSKADFEIYNELPDMDNIDTDNPDVPNLLKWYDGDTDYFTLNTRGNKAYALARPTVDLATFLEKYKYTFTYTFTYDGYVIPMDEDGFRIPNEWVLDAVNLSTQGGYQWNVTSSQLDFGWTYCGTTEYDEQRYGKSVIRKKENGKWVDTNNSTNDFTPNSQPSMMK
ncbi:MAG: DUF4876 domain-containing protein [Paraprevotella sp.]|nr:DUF4876 domain-containing protein [Paraprevotella sp.]